MTATQETVETFMPFDPDMFTKLDAEREEQKSAWHLLLLSMEVPDEEWLEIGAINRKKVVEYVEALSRFKGHAERTLDLAETAFERMRKVAERVGAHA